MPIKVLHFYRTYFPDTQGGLEEAIRQLCRSTQSYGVESRVLTLSPNPIPQVIEFPEAFVFRAKLDLDVASCSMGLEAFSMFSELEKWADVVHYHFPWPFADIVKLVSRSSKPSVVTYHSDIVRQRWLSILYRPLMNWFLQSATRIVATSPNYVESSRFLNQWRRKLSVIPIGIDKRTYPELNPNIAKEIKEKYGNKYFLFVGVLREYKGLNSLIDACQKAQFTVLIAGAGPKEAALRKRAQKLGLDNVVFLGYITDEMKIALLNGCLAVVLPSHLRSEAFGVFLLEGAMMGKPLVSMEIGTGTSFINLDHETGFTAKPGKAWELRRLLDALFSDVENAKLLGGRAQLRYDKYFTAQRMGANYYALYQSVTERTG